MAFLAPNSAMRFRLACLALLTAPLFGCDPIDQRTFDPTAGKPPQIPAPQPTLIHEKPAFMEISEGTAEAEYGPAVEKATKLALTHKSNMLFIIESMAPMQETPEADVRILQNLTKDLTTHIAKHVLTAGARPIQLDMRATTNPAIQKPLVRIYVR